jgi:hypothetical protein
VLLNRIMPTSPILLIIDKSVIVSKASGLPGSESSMNNKTEAALSLTEDGG